MKLSPLLFALMLGASTLGIAQTTTPISRPLPPSSTQGKTQVAKLVIPAAPFVPSYNDINSQVQIAITNGTVVVPKATKVVGTPATDYFFFRIYPYGTERYYEARFTCVWGLGVFDFTLDQNFGGTYQDAPAIFPVDHTKSLCPTGSGAWDLTKVWGSADADHSSGLN